MRKHRRPRLDAIDVQLRAAWIRRVGYRYDVILGGDVIVRRSGDPEHEAARALRSRGLSGTFRTTDFVTGKPRMILDIEKTAGLRTVERDRGGLSIEPYMPMSDDDISRLRPPGLLHERPPSPGMAEDTDYPLPAVAGGTAGALSYIHEEA